MSNGHGTPRVQVKRAWSRIHRLAGEGLVRSSAVLGGRAWRAGFAEGKRAGQMIGRRLLLPERAEADNLAPALASLLRSAGLRRTVPAAELRALRKLAVRNRIGDTDGLAAAALALLADRFDDETARAWLPIVLAEAGQFAESAEAPLGFAKGGPAARSYLMTVTAMHQLGRTEEAAERMATLDLRYAGLADQAVHLWGTDPVAEQYRRLVQRAAAHDGALPVFVHLPFCGGTSMQHALQLVVPWARTLQIGRRWGLLQIEQAGALRPDQVSALMMVHQHHAFALELGRPLIHFTVLRDPVSQLRSGFYKREAKSKIVSTRDAGSRSFAEHADYTIRSGLTNMMARQIVTAHPALRPSYRQHYSASAAYTVTRYEEEMFWLAATRRLGDDQLLAMARETLDQQYAVVGTMKHLAASHLASTAAVGVPVAYRLTHRGKSGQPRGPVSNAVEERLRHANAVDQQLYDDYTRRFEAGYPELITALQSETPVLSRSKNS